MLYPALEANRHVMQFSNDGFGLAAANQRMIISLAEHWGLVPSAAAKRARGLLAATTDVSERLARDHVKPELGLHETCISGEKVAVREVVVSDSPWGPLKKLERGIDRNDPNVLVGVPQSGHYPSLLRQTMRRLLPAHNVYYIDWQNARDVSLEHGDFALEDSIGHYVDYIKGIGSDTHVLAVCQAAVPAVAAVAHLAEKAPAAQPLSLTLMGGPLDTSVAPTVVTEFAKRHSIGWFAQNMIARVPSRHRGAGRLVYPGKVQLGCFIGMNPSKHVRAMQELSIALIEGDIAKADKTTEFYSEYFAVCDLSARFYLDSVDKVFIRQDLARGELTYQGSRVDPAAIIKTSVLTVEGANDDISAPGQTYAVHDWLTGLQPWQHEHLLQPGVGHYGLFSGNTWRTEIAPRFEGFIRTAAARQGIEYDPIEKRRPRRRRF